MANSFDFQIRPLRRVEYDKLVELGVFEGERLELLDGQLVQMTPPGPPHASTVDKLMELFVRGLGDRARIRVQSKLRVYAEAAVAEYWIVDVQGRCIEVHRKPGSGRYWQVQQYGEAATLSPERYPDFELRVADVLPSAK